MTDSAPAHATAAAPSFAGIYPILATPFDADDQLDLPSLDRLVRFMVAADVDGVTVTGVLGESNRLLDRERVVIVRTAVAATEGRVPVIVGTSHSGTLAARALSQEAEALGAAAVMLTPHAEATPNDARVFEYFRTVADGVRIPVVVQDHPASSNVHMSAPLLLKLVAEVPRVACIKLEAVPTAPKLRALKAGFTQRSVPILTGLGALYGLFDLRAGASGFNTGFAFPEVLAAMLAHANAGRWREAEQVYQRFLPLIVFEQQPGPAIRKAILARRGLLASSRVRHPSVQIDAAVEEELGRLLDLCLPGVDVTRPITV